MQLTRLTAEREEAAELRSMAKRDAAKEYAVKLDANEKKLKEARLHRHVVRICSRPCVCFGAVFGRLNEQLMLRVGT